MSLLKIVIVTEAWKPQINGVVTTLTATAGQLRSQGYYVSFITPEHFATFPLPSYKSIRIAIFPYTKVARILVSAKPDIVHIATEGPLGLAARRFCLRHGIRFTTSYHTQFPEYLRLRVPFPVSWSYAYLRWFHSAAERVLVPTEQVRKNLTRKGFKNTVIWGRGVDTDLFSPEARPAISLEKPVFLYVGRVSVEKNIQAFLDLDLPGTKLVVGDGPDLPRLTKQYPETCFVGFKTGIELVECMTSADVFVFPSRTDTFGVVMLEAMACGLPVAAFPVAGPIDVVINGVNGVLDNDLGIAAKKAMLINKNACREYALNHSWYRATLQFSSHLEVNATTKKQLNRIACVAP